MASAPAEMNAKPAINALNAGIVQPNSSAHFNRKAALLYVSHTRAAYCTITGQCESKNFGGSSDYQRQSVTAIFGQGWQLDANVGFVFLVFPFGRLSILPDPDCRRRALFAIRHALCL